MLTPKYMKKLPDNIQEYYRNLEDRTLKDIVKRINKSCTIAETTSEVRIQSLLNLGYDLKDIKKELSKDLDITAHKLGSLVNEAGLKSYAEDAKFYAAGGKRLKENPAVLKMIDTMSKSSVEDLNNLTGTIGLAGKPLEKWYKETLNQAVIDITSGTYARSEVMRRVVKDIGDKGLEYIEYSSGRNFSVEAAVKMNLVSSVNRLSAEISLKNAEEMDQDLMELTAHAGARPTHQEWQGQIVSLSGNPDYLSLNDIGYGSAEGFMGVNCRHNWYPYFPGKSKRFWDDETLETFKYKGKTYDEHSAYQRIRNLEKTARKYERKAKLFKAIGDKEAETTERVREQIVKQEQKKFQKVIKNNETCYNINKYSYLEDGLEEAKKHFSQCSAEENFIINDSEFRYVGTWRSFSMNQYLRTGDLSALEGEDEKYLETINVLKNVINSNKTHKDFICDRYVDGNWLKNFISGSKVNSNIAFEDIAEELNKHIGYVKEQKGFISASVTPTNNVFTDRPIKLELYVPKGTHCYATTNDLESEIIFNTGIKFNLREAIYDENNQNMILKIVIEEV